ncbi:hypothetical protein R1T40_07850 [Tritonibacter scottomollicae]|uniref:Uncharacterized protein n=1 Tax=Tritonibacter scottomollicae TaxID=483013 RepID=A0ABZ0HKS4_TRISK|nr:hypothetical protein R1T40_07850 [Tritonibacter scottomollicae]
MLRQSNPANHPELTGYGGASLRMGSSGDPEIRCKMPKRGAALLHDAPVIPARVLGSRAA